MRELLSREIANGPIAAALAIRAQVQADVTAAIEHVDSPGTELAERVAMLLALALVAHDGTALPDQVLEVLEDDLLVDAVIAARAEAAITGLLAACPNVGDRLRNYLALRLAAAGSVGLHVATLLLSVDDVLGASRAALPDLVASVRANAADDELMHAIAAVVVDWARQNPSFGERLCATLPADVAAVLAPAARAFDPYTAALLDAVR